MNKKLEIQYLKVCDKINLLQRKLEVLEISKQQIKIKLTENKK